jgi:hypothetical protein
LLPIVSLSIILRPFFSPPLLDPSSSFYSQRMQAFLAITK